MSDIAAQLSRLSPQQRRLLEQRLSARAASTHEGIRRRRPDEPPQLSFSQIRLWYLEQLNPGTVTYTVPCAFRGQGRLNREAFRAAVNLIVERHAVLRTTITTSVQGEPVCRVADHWDTVEFIALDQHGDTEAAALQLVSSVAQRPFDIARDLMLRVLVVVIDADSFAVLVSAHHIAWDGASKAVFFDELALAYEALSRGEQPKFPTLAIDYADYALWQRRSYAGAMRDTEAAYWKAQLTSAAPYLNLPLDKSRPALQRFVGEKLFFEFSQQVIGAAQAFSRAERVTQYATLLAAFYILLLALTGQEDISVAAPFAGRDEPATQNLIGFFANTLVLRARVSASAGFAHILRSVNQCLLGAQAHHGMPMDQLVDILRPPRDPGRMPLVQVNFRLQTGKRPELRLSGLGIRPMPLIDTFVSRFDLALEVASAPGESGYLEYNTDLFDATRMGQIPAAYQSLLGELLAAPQTAVGSLNAFVAVAQIRSKRRRLVSAVGRSNARTLQDN
jgi:hypothetical protein